jgi:hypothetical protein
MKYQQWLNKKHSKLTQSRRETWKRKQALDLLRVEIHRLDLGRDKYARVSTDWNRRILQFKSELPAVAIPADFGKRGPEAHVRNQEYKSPALGQVRSIARQSIHYSDIVTPMSSIRAPPPALGVTVPSSALSSQKVIPEKGLSGSIPPPDPSRQLHAPAVVLQQEAVPIPIGLETQLQQPEVIVPRRETKAVAEWRFAQNGGVRTTGLMALLKDPKFEEFKNKKQADLAAEKKAAADKEYAAKVLADQQAKDAAAAEKERVEREKERVEREAQERKDAEQKAKEKEAADKKRGAFFDREPEEDDVLAQVTRKSMRGISSPRTEHQQILDRRERLRTEQWVGIEKKIQNVNSRS